MELGAGIIVAGYFIFRSLRQRENTPESSNSPELDMNFRMRQRRDNSPRRSETPDCGLSYNYWSGDSIRETSERKSSPDRGQKIRRLDRLFLTFKWDDNCKKCNKILKKFVSIAVERKFQQYIETFSSKNDIHIMSEEDFNKLDADLKKTRVRSYIPYSRRRVQPRDRQLIMYSAWNFITLCPPLTSSMFLNQNIDDLDIPMLLDIVWNCYLFESIHEYIGQIVDAYLDTEQAEKGLKRLKSSMEACLDKIDDAMLPNKSHFQDQLTRMDAMNESASNQTYEVKTLPISDELTIRTAGQNQRKLDELYRKFEKNYTYEYMPCSETLRDFVSDFVERTFREFIEQCSSKNDIHAMSVEDIKKLDAKLNKLVDCSNTQDLKSGRIPHRCCQLIIYAASKFISSNQTKRGSMKFFRENIDDLNVPTLLDIMWNCSLFDSIHGYISKIVDAYLDIKPSDKLYVEPNHLMSAIGAFQDQLRKNNAVRNSKSQKSSREETDLDMKETQCAMEKAENEMRERQVALEKAENDLKKRQYAIDKAEQELKERQCALEKEENELKERQSTLDKSEAENQIHVEIAEQLKMTLRSLQNEINSLNGMLEGSEPIHEMKTDAMNARIANIEADLQNPHYINWVKGTLLLNYLSKGARHFILLVFKKFQKELPYGSHFDKGANIQRLCDQGVKFVSGEWTYLDNIIQCDDCNKLFKEVKNRHNRLNYYAGFHNCKGTPVDGAWGIAKLFLPGNCGGVDTPEKSDTQALFQLILNCNLFSKITVANVEKIIKTRNELMHSPNLAMEDDLFKELYVCEIEFVEEVINELKEDDESDARQKMESSKADIEQIYKCKMEIKTLIGHAEMAFQYEEEEVEKHLNHEDNESNSQIKEKQKMLQNKHECYKTVEASPEHGFQHKNPGLTETIAFILNELKKTYIFLEKAKHKMDNNEQMQEKRICQDTKYLMCHV